MTYLAIAASPKRLHDHFAAGVSTYHDRHGILPAACVLHPETAAALTIRDARIDLIPHAGVAKWNLYFGPLEETS